jgi:hypothetical protein
MARMIGVAGVIIAIVWVRWLLFCSPKALATYAYALSQELIVRVLLGTVV